MPGECGGHALTILHADARRRNQALHRQLRCDGSLAHLLLDGFWQEFHQCQPPRHPTLAAVEPPCQFLDRVAIALLHLHQQPALLQGRFRLAQPQRPLQQQRFGFTHWPEGRFDGVPAQLPQCRNAFVAVDHQVRWIGRPGAWVFNRDHDNRCLLARFGQRGQQSAVALRLP